MIDTEITDEDLQLHRELQQHDMGLKKLAGQVQYMAGGRALSHLGSRVIQLAWERAQEARVLPAGRNGQVAHCFKVEEIVKECALWTLSYIVGNVTDSRVKYKLAAFIGQRCEWISFLRDPKIQGSWHLQDTRHHNFLDLGVANTIALLQRRESLGSKWEWAPLDQAQRVTLGFFYLDACVEATGWFDYKGSFDGTRRSSLVVPNEGYRQYLRDYSRVVYSIGRPLHAPMICRPVPFDPVYEDGKIVNPDKLYSEPGYRTLRTSSSSVAMEAWPDHCRKAKPWVWSAVNKIQDAEIALDPHVTQLVRDMWDTGNPMGGMPTRDPRSLPRHTGLDRVYEREMFLYRRDHRLDTERARVICFLQAIDETLIERGSFYFPAHLDHRGRVYTRGSHLNYLGSDWMRQSLDFAERAPVKPHEAELLAEIERAHGGPIDTQKVLAIGHDPMGTQSLWRHTKSPWRLAKLAHEFSCFAANPGYTTGCPFPLDQTTSGFGHLAMLTRDERLARHANCVGTSGSDPCDIYMSVSDRAKGINEVLTYDSRDPKVIQAAVWCRSNWPPRSVWKRVVMPAVYGQSFKSIMEVMREFVTGALDRQVIMDGLRSSDIVVHLARLANQVVRSTLPGVHGLTRWLQAIGKEYLKLGTPMHWHSPSGLKVLSYQGDRGRADIELILSGRRVRIQPQVSDDGKYKLRPTVGRQVGADFIHSYDAAFLHYAVSQWRGNSILCAHDSFAVPLDQRARLKDHLNESWARFYQTDYLTQLHGYATMLTGARLPAPPIVGDLDMSAVGMSDHLFA